MAPHRKSMAKGKRGSVQGPGHSGQLGMDVRVIVRKRPVPDEQVDVLTVNAPRISILEHKVKVDLTKYDDKHDYIYDDTFGDYDDTRNVYQRSVQDLIENVFSGGTSTAFCFGQTASGKTFTLFGAGGGQSEHDPREGDMNIVGQKGGLYLLSAHDIYERMFELNAIDPSAMVALSMYEIKGQKMYDLMNDRKELTALEDGNGVLQLVGLTQHACENLDQFLDATNVGRNARSTTATGANATSSRSHCAMLIRVYKQDKLLGKLSLIDLAGSERGADNENTDKTTQKEGRDINTSLLALKEVIRSLQNGNHAPFRQSRLTQVLEESLTGEKCRTVVIACVSGAEHDTQHTINTLRYAHDLRPKRLKGSMDDGHLSKSSSSSGSHRASIASSRGQSLPRASTSTTAHRMSQVAAPSDYLQMMSSDKDDDNMLFTPTEQATSPHHAPPQPRRSGSKKEKSPSKLGGVLRRLGSFKTSESDSPKQKTPAFKKSNSLSVTKANKATMSKGGSVREGSQGRSSISQGRSSASHGRNSVTHGHGSMREHSHGRNSMREHGHGRNSMREREGMNVQVIVRKRPVAEGEEDVLAVDTPTVTVLEHKVKVDLTKYNDAHAYGYDDAFGEEDNTKVLYDRSIGTLVANLFDGGTSTCFCFGQTASGKTFTIFGAGGGQASHGMEGQDSADRGGVYLLSAHDIYMRANELKESDPSVMVALSMYEIKGQKLYDLLNDRKELTALEDGDGVLQLVGLTQHACENLDEFLDATNVGRSARSTTATGANATSSRSHCAMLIRVYKQDKLLGKLSLIDLAGSERGADNENTDKTTQKEGRDINTSLLALKEVIRSLQNGNHVPFRQSRLTQVLEESLTGKQCRTVVIACVSGAEHDTHHSINTLRYAQDLRPNGKDKIGRKQKQMAVNKMLMNAKALQSLQSPSKPSFIQHAVSPRKTIGRSSSLEVRVSPSPSRPMAPRSHTAVEEVEVEEKEADNKDEMEDEDEISDLPMSPPAAPSLMKRSPSFMDRIGNFSGTGANKHRGRKSVSMKSKGGSKESAHTGRVGMAVQVIVRKRPVAEGEEDVLAVDTPTVTILEHKTKVDMTKYDDAHAYAYDHAFGEGNDTKSVYDRSISDLVANVFAGGTSTCFCFGQTASGKTFTLFGAGGGKVTHGMEGSNNAEQGGLYLLSAYAIYEKALKLHASESGIVVALSMYEIKGQKLYDLLNDRKELTALEDGNGVLQLVGLTQHACINISEFLDATNVGRSARSTTATGANATSSRSHCAMLIRVYKQDMLLGKLSLIDLAGSERGADNENTDKATQKEGRDINTSLLALKEVIRALQQGNHAPFRQSRLTQVLEESLTGQQCRTVVIACVSGAAHDTQHTINTLRYAMDLRPAKKGRKSVAQSVVWTRTKSDEHHDSQKPMTWRRSKSQSEEKSLKKLSLEERTLKKKNSWSKSSTLSSRKEKSSQPKAAWKRSQSQSEERGASQPSKMVNYWKRSQSQSEETEPKSPKMSPNSKKKPVGMSPTALKESSDREISGDSQPRSPVSWNGSNKEEQEDSTPGDIGSSYTSASSKQPLMKKKIPMRQTEEEKKKPMSPNKTSEKNSRSLKFQAMSSPNQAKNDDLDIMKDFNDFTTRVGNNSFDLLEGVHSTPKIHTPKNNTPKNNTPKNSTPKNSTPRSDKKKQVVQSSPRSKSLQNRSTTVSFNGGGATSKQTSRSSPRGNTKNKLSSPSSKKKKGSKEPSLPPPTSPRTKRMIKITEIGLNEDDSEDDGPESDRRFSFEEMLEKSDYRDLIDVEVSKSTEAIHQSKRLSMLYAKLMISGEHSDDYSSLGSCI